MFVKGVENKNPKKKTTLSGGRVSEVTPCRVCVTRPLEGLHHEGNQIFHTYGDDLVVREVEDVLSSDLTDEEGGGGVLHTVIVPKIHHPVYPFARKSFRIFLLVLATHSTRFVVQ